jgi:hypothetical protein
MSLDFLMDKTAVLVPAAAADPSTTSRLAAFT